MVVKVLIGYEMHVKLRQDDETMAMSLSKSNCLQYIGEVDNDNTSYAKISVCNGKVSNWICSFAAFMCLKLKFITGSQGDNLYKDGNA